MIEHQRRLWWIGVVVLVGFSSWVIFFNLGANSLHNFDEAEHALVALDTAQSSEWATLTKGGQPWHLKAPLGFWLAGVAFEVFGVNAFAVRFWSAVFGVATVALVALAGARLVGRRAALVAAFVLATNLPFVYVHGAKTGELDTQVVFLLTTAFLLAARDPGSRLSVFVPAAALGLCGMSKHIVYIAPPLLILAAHAVWTGTWRRLGGKRIALAGLLIAIIVLPWHLYQVLRYGQPFIETYYLEQFVSRLQGDLDPVGRHGPSFFFSVAFHGLFPWAFLVGAAVLGGLRRLHSDDAVQRLLMLWVVVYFVAISVSAGKHSWYILPIYPALALLVGRFIVDVLEQPRGRLVQLSFAAAFLATLSLTAMPRNPFELPAFDALSEVRLRDAFELVHQRSEALAWLGALASLGALLWGWDLWLRRDPSSVIRRWLAAAALAYLGVVSVQDVVAPLRYSDHQACYHQLIRWVAERGSEKTELTLLSNDLRARFHARELLPAFELGSCGRPRSDRPRRAPDPDRLFLINYARRGSAPALVQVDKAVRQCGPWALLRDVPADLCSPS